MDYWVERGPGTMDTSVGNVEVVPEFVPSEGFFPSYRLLYPSPLIDAGDPADTLSEDRAGGLARWTGTA